MSVLKDKIADRLVKEDELKSSIIKQSLVCDELKARNENIMGPRERILSSKLEEIKVVRQAYHGTVFVGNHCKLVLKNHGTVCSAISDKIDMHKNL